MDDKQKVDILLQLIKEKGIDEVVKEFSLSMKFHERYPNLLQLCYDQINSDLSHPVSQVCRGILLDKEDEFKVIAFPYIKFFNFGESKADTIDWESAKVYEKLDGSILTLYWYKDEWHVSSKGLPDARGRLVGFTRLHGQQTQKEGPSFKDEFWRIWKEENYVLPTDKSRCYMFELMLKNVKNVVHSPKDRVVLHGARNLETFQELDPVVVSAEHNWDCVEITEFGSMKEVIAHAETLQPHLAEGFVVCDKNFNRVKIKSPMYVALSLISDLSGVSATRRMLAIVLANEDSEYLAYFPQMAELFTETKTNFDAMAAYIQSQYDVIIAKSGDNGRIFVEEMKSRPELGVANNIFFECKKRGKRVRDVLRDWEPKKVEGVLNWFLKLDVQK